METNYMIAAGVSMKERKAIQREIKIERLSIGREAAKRAHEERVRKERKQISNLAKLISFYFNEDVFINTRRREVIIKRQIGHYFAKELELGFFQCISAEMGNKEHASVYNSLRVVKNLIETQSTIKNAFYTRDTRNKKENQTIIVATKSFKASDKFSDLIEDIRAYIKLKFNQYAENEN